MSFYIDNYVKPPKKTKRKLQSPDSVTIDTKQTKKPKAEKLLKEFEHSISPSEKEAELVQDMDVYETPKKQRGASKQLPNPEEKMKFIKNFVEISLKYSQFLKEKIDKKDIREEASAAVALEKEQVNITEQLKYFEGGDLRPYQIEGVTWLTVLFENSVNGILADEMGLGKTIQIIALFCHLYERKVTGPFLIVVPLSTLGNWETEFKKFAPKIPVVRLQGSASERTQQMMYIHQNKFILDGRKVQPVVLCSYQIPLIEEHFLKKHLWQYIVVDEGHRIKNSDSKLSQELRALNSVNRTLLTGTPLQNDIKELWALFNFLMPQLFQDIQGFSSLIELEDMEDKDKILENEAQTKLISTIHKVLAPFMLRREKKYVLPDIVPKKEVIIYCPLSDLQKYMYRAILRKDMDKLYMRKPSPDEGGTPRGKRKCASEKINYKECFDLENGYYLKGVKKLKNRRTEVSFPNKENVPVNCPNCEYICRITMTNVTMMLRKATNHPYLIWHPMDPKGKNREMLVDEDLVKHSGKLMVLDALLPKLTAKGHKILIFSTLVMFMDIIEEYFIMRGYSYRRFDGATDYTTRNENINEFISDPNISIFLLSTRAGGLGLNLTAADTVIFMDRDWNPMADLQAQDRCHRIGQNRPVMVYSLIVKNTVDEIIVRRGDMKKRLEKVVIKEGQFTALKKNLDDTELQELEELLNSEDKMTKIHANGLVYTNKELNQILDRTDLIAQMENDSKKQTSPKAI